MTPAQQIAIATIIQEAAEHALIRRYGKSWNIVNGVIDVPDEQAALAPGSTSLFRRVAEKRALDRAERLALFFSEAEITAMAQPPDPAL